MPGLFGSGYSAWILLEMVLMRSAGMIAFWKTLRFAPVEMPVAGS